MFEWLKKAISESTKPASVSAPCFDNLGIGPRDFIFDLLDFKSIRNLAMSSSTLNEFFKKRDKKFEVKFSGCTKVKFTYAEICEKFCQHNERINQYRMKVSAHQQRVRENAQQLESARNPVLKPIFSTVSQMTKEEGIPTQIDNNTNSPLIYTSSTCGCFGLCIGSIVGGGIGGNFFQAFLWGLISLAGGCSMGVCVVICCSSASAYCFKPLGDYSTKQLIEYERELQSMEQNFTTPLNQEKILLENEKKRIAQESPPVFYM